MNTLNDREIEFVKEVYVNFENDLRDSLKFYNPETGFLPEEFKETVRALSIDFQPDEEHKEITGYRIQF